MTSLLHDAAKTGNIAIIQRLIDEGVHQFMHVDSESMTPLDRAILSDNLGAVRLLCNNMRHIDIVTSCETAVVNNKNVALRILLSYGCQRINDDDVNAGICGALWRACYIGNLNAIKTIFAMVVIDELDIDRRFSPLALAYSCGYQALVDYFLNDPQPMWAHLIGCHLPGSCLAAHQMREFLRMMLDRSEESMDEVLRTLALRDGTMCEIVQAFLPTCQHWPLDDAKRAELRQRYLFDAPVEIFALIVMVSDDYLVASDKTSQAGRFFAIGKKLPMDLQGLLAHRLAGSAGTVVRSSDFERGLSRFW